MILAILIVSLLTVSAVNAEDNATSDILGVDETADEVVSINNDNQEILEVNNVETLADLSNEITQSGSVLNLTKNYKCSYNDSSISIKKSLTINGNGCTIDGNKQVRIFDVADNVNVVLNNISFINCFINEDYGNGGAIYNGGNLTVNNCSFVDCSAGYEESYGGAIYSKIKGFLAVNNCIFMNTRSDDGAAGAIAGADSIVNCSFVGCHSGPYSGGAICSYKSLIVMGCSFVNCYSGSDGGAIFAQDGLIVRDCSFVNCSACSGGAIIMYIWGSLNVSNCSFADCSAYDGGAIYSYDVDAFVADCTFVDCSASRDTNGNGGAICNDNDYGKISAVNCTFINNTATGYGGATYKCNVMDCIFKGNIAGKAGNDVYPLKYSLNVSDFSSVYKSGDKLIINLIDSEGSSITGAKIKIDIYKGNYIIGTYYCLSGDGWVVTLTPGNYTALVSFDDGATSSHLNTTANVVVTKAVTVISASDVSVSYNDPNGKLVATIITEHGNPFVINCLDINLNGVNYVVKTDSKGQASIPVRNLVPGEYNATISYRGSSNYKASNVTVLVNVTKAATVISALDVSVAYNDPSGELVATIVNEHGTSIVANLNINLNGETYTAKTDSKGKLSVSTADLPPGNYIATISYNGSGNYTASSTTANIKVNP